MWHLRPQKLWKMWYLRTLKNAVKAEEDLRKSYNVKSAQLQKQKEEAFCYSNTYHFVAMEHPTINCNSHHGFWSRMVIWLLRMSMLLKLRLYLQDLTMLLLWWFYQHLSVKPEKQPKNYPHLEKILVFLLKHRLFKKTFLYSSCLKSVVTDGLKFHSWLKMIFEIGSLLLWNCC